MRKIIIFLVAILLIGTIAATGCTSNQMPKDNNQIPDLVFNSTNNTTHNTTKVVATARSTATPTPKPTATPAPTYVSTPVPTAYPTPLPSATPTPTPAPPVTCTHVDIVDYHPLNTPCMMCAQRYGTLSEYAQQHSPYVTASFVSIDNSTWSADTVRISATVRETGQTMSWVEALPEVMVWCNSYLTCK